MIRRKGREWTNMWPVIVTVLGIIFYFLLGPSIVLLLIPVMFGLVLSSYLRTVEMHNDIQSINEKLGIEEREDFHWSDEEIEAELEKEWNK